MADSKAELKIVARIKDFATKRFRQMGTAARVFGRVGYKSIRFVGKGVAWTARQLLSLKAALTGIAALFIGGSLLDGAKQIAQQTAEFDRWSRKLRIGTKELSGLQFAAEQSGADFEILVEGMKTMQERLDDAARGTATYVEHLDAIGVSARDAHGRVRNIAEVLPEISAGVQQLAKTDPGRLTLFAEDFIGGSENVLQLLLEKGPEALKRYQEAASKLGLIITPEQAARAREWVQAWKTLEAVSTRLLQKAVDQLLPTGFVDALTNFLAANGQRIVDWLIARIRTAIDLVRTLVGAIQSLVEFLQTPFESGVLTYLEDARKKIFGSGLLPDAKAIRDQMRDAGRILEIELKSMYAGLSNADGVPFAQLAEQTEAQIRALGKEFTRLGGSAREAGSIIDNAVLGAGSGLGAALDDPRSFSEKYRKAVVDLEQLRKDTQADRGGDGAVSSAIGPNGERLRNFFAFFKREAKAAIAAWTAFGDAGIQAGRSIVDSVGNNLSNAISAGITKIRSWKDAWKEAGNAILKQLADIASKLAVMGLFKAVGSFIPGIGALGSIFAAKGAYFPGGLRRLARGGMTDGPEIAVIGDNPGGKEFVMPAARGPGGQLGVRAFGGGGGPTRVAVHVDMRVSALDADGVEGVLGRNMPQLGKAIATAIEERRDVQAAIRGAR